MTECGFDRHDHDRCREMALAEAAAFCAARGLQMTPVRRRVLELLLDTPKSQGAYDLLPRLAEEGLGRQPPVIYRALDFLVGHGFAHRLEGRNAYVACTVPGERHDAAFLICRSCDRVAEARQPTPRRLDVEAAACGFRIERTTVEALGLCPDCRA